MTILLRLILMLCGAVAGFFVGIALAKTTFSGGLGEADSTELLTFTILFILPVVILAWIGWALGGMFGGKKRR